MKKIQRLFDIDPWKIATTTLDKENRRLQESLTSIEMATWGCGVILKNNIVAITI